VSFTRRGLLTGLGVGPVATLLAACGASPQAQAPSPTQPPQAAKPATSANAAAPALTKENVNLVFIGHVAGGQDEQRAYDKILESWNKSHPNIQTEYQVIPDAERIQRMTAMVAADQAPDMWRHNFGVVRLWASQGHLLDLTDMMPKDYDKQFLPALMGAHYFKGHYYALPHTTDTSALFYREDALDAIGAKAPTDLKDAWTWQQFRDICDKLVKLGKQQFAFSHNQGGGRWVPQFFYSTGAKVVSDDFSKMTFNTPEGLEALRFVKDWHDKKWVPPALWGPTRPNEENDPFIRGTTSMAHVGQWNITYLDENIRQTFKWGATFTPHAKMQVTSLGGTPLVGWKKTKHPQEVAAFLEFFTSTENVKLFDEMANYMPVRNDLLDQTLAFGTRNDLMQVFKQQIRTLPLDFVAYTARSYSSGIGPIITEETTKMNLQGQSPEDTAKNVDTRGNKFIQDNPDVESK
jgi:multiple sugar transport system substrate-binding protein